MMSGNIIVKTSIELDPKAGKAFVADTKKVMHDVDKTVTESAASSRKSFDQIFSTGLIARLALAGFAMQRLAAQADEPTRQAKEMRAEFDELGAELGNTISAAGGAILSGLSPGIKALKDASGATQGLLLGLSSIVTIGPTVLKILSFAGLSGSPVLGTVVLGLSAIGAAIGAVGDRARQNERDINTLLKTFSLKSSDELKQDIEDTSTALEELNSQITELEYKATRGAGKSLLERLGLSIPSQQQQTDLANLRAERKEKESTLDLEKQIYQQRIALQTISATPRTTESASELLARLNTEIALGKTRLSNARNDIKAKEEELQKQYQLINTLGPISLKEKESVLNAEEKAKWEEATGDIKKRQAIVDAASKRIYGELLALQNARADLTERIGTQAEKERSEVYNRAILEAKLQDILKAAGPVLELQAVRQERIKLETEGQGEAATRILELRLKELELEGSILDVLKRQALARTENEIAEGKRLQAARARAAEFGEQLESGISEAQGTAPGRAEQIRRLQQELGLIRLTSDALREKAAFINDSVGQTMTLEEAERQRDKLLELTRLLSDERQESIRGLVELQDILRGGVRSAADGVGQSFVDMFAKGKDAGESFGKFMEQLIQRLAAQLIGSALFSFFAGMLFPGSGLILGTGGAARGLPSPFDFGGGGFASAGESPRFFVPTPTGGSVASLQNELSELRRTNEALVQAIADGSIVKMQVEPMRAHGKELRTVFQRVEAEAAGLKL